MSTELRATIQRLYVETLQRVDGALTAICSEFEPIRYSKAGSQTTMMALGLNREGRAPLRWGRSVVSRACSALDSSQFRGDPAAIARCVHSHLKNRSTNYEMRAQLMS